MKKPARKSFHLRLFAVLILAALIGLIFLMIKRSQPAQSPVESIEQLNLIYLKEIQLPSPAKTSRFSLEQALQQNKDTRKFLDKSLNLKQISQLVWSLQGVTASWGGRTATSTRSTFPLEIYLVALKVEDLDPGIYRYLPGDIQPIHKLGLLKEGDFTNDLLQAAKEQSAIKNAPAVFVLTGNFQKMTAAFQGTPANENVYLEAGKATQNLYLQVRSLGLGTFSTSNFDQALTYQLINSPVNERLIYLLPVGYPDET